MNCSALYRDLKNSGHNIQINQAFTYSGTIIAEREREREREREVIR
jgi:hypothetical protein